MRLLASRRQAAASANLQRLGQVMSRSLDEALMELAMSAGAYIAAGDRALARIDFLTAVDCFTRAAELEPNNLDAFKGLAIALTAAGRHEQAIAVYETILAGVGDDRTTLFNLGVACSRVRQLGKAQFYLRQAVRKYPDFMQAWYNLGSVYESQGKLIDAREAWQRAAALAPGLAHPHAKLAETLMDLGEPNQAMDEFAEAAKTEPESIDLQLNLATAAVQCRSYARALVAIRRAAALAPNDAEIWSSLGELLADVYRSTGDDKARREALDAFDAALKLNPKHPQANAALKRLRKDSRSQKDHAP